MSATAIIQKGTYDIGHQLSKKFKNGTVGIYSIKNQFFDTLPQLVGSALIIVTALAWNDAMSSVIDYYVPEDIAQAHNVWWKVAYAFVLTVIMVILTIVLYYLSTRASQAIDTIIPESVLEEAIKHEKETLSEEEKN